METLIVSLILLMVNLIMIYRPLPILAFPVELFTAYIYATQFLYDSSLPLQPYYTIFLVLVNVGGMTVNALTMRKK